MVCIKRKELRRAFTLLELLAVVAVMAIVAMLAVTKVGDMVRRSRIAAAEADLATLRDAILDSESGYLHDMRGLAGFSMADIRLANILIPTNLYGLASSSSGVFPRASRLDERWLGESVARPLEFTTWDEERSRGWRGPYACGRVGFFPSAEEAADRGFYPDVSSLYLPTDFTSRRNASIYGFPGEAALLDPWGNPYVLQVPPPQAFADTGESVVGVSPETRFAYARLVSAGADGRLDTPCFQVNATNDATVTAWNERTRRLSRQAGLIDASDKFLRGDDIVLFLNRNDIDE